MLLHLLLECGTEAKASPVKFLLIAMSQSALHWTAFSFLLRMAVVKTEAKASPVKLSLIAMRQSAI